MVRSRMVTSTYLFGWFDNGIKILTLKTKAPLTVSLPYTLSLRLPLFKITMILNSMFLFALLSVSYSLTASIVGLLL